MTNLMSSSIAARESVAAITTSHAESSPLVDSEQSRGASKTTFPSGAPETCPLCESVNSLQIDSIDTRALVWAYRRFLKVDVRPYLDISTPIRFSLCQSCDLRFFSPALPGPASFYEQLLHFSWYYLQNKPEYQWARELISATDDVLEIGCGAAAFAKIIAPKSYTGVELTDAAAQQAREAGFNVLISSVDELTQRDSLSFDVVCAFQVLEHVPNPKSFLTDAAAALRPGGRLIISVPSADSYLRCMPSGVLNMPPHHMTWWSDAALTSVAEVTGLQLECIHHEGLAPLHYASYVQAIVSRGLNHRFGRAWRLLDTTIPGLVTKALGVWAGRLLAPGVSDIGPLPNGHTVSAVFRRRS